MSELTYYNQTHTFYDTYYEDIEDLRLTYEEEIGQPLEIQGDLKNFLAWFAFEAITQQIASELDLDT